MIWAQPRCAQSNSVVVRCHVMRERCAFVEVVRQHHSRMPLRRQARGRNYAPPCHRVPKQRHGASNCSRCVCSESPSDVSIGHHTPFGHLAHDREHVVNELLVWHSLSVKPSERYEYSETPSNDPTVKVTITAMVPKVS